MADQRSDVATHEELPAPSRAIRDVRVAQGLSLRALSARAGIRLAQALNVDIRDILANPDQPAAPVAVGRRSVTRAGEGLDADSEKHFHHYPAAELLGKMMIPIIIDVQARSVDELGGLVRHGGEEYLYVLSGSMELHSDLYAPLPLGRGDSVYFDSGMSHGYVRTSSCACSVLTVCAGQGIRQLADTASKRHHLSQAADHND
jgi:mannose-6-phosphate isomerase-like protein (cupin superfamily)